MNKSVLFASLLALAGVSSAASAADDSWFVRGEVGHSRLSVSGGHETDTSFSARGGYYFNHYIGLEGFYTDFGSKNGGKIDGWGVGVVGKTNFGPNNTGWFISGRAGAMRVKTKLDLGIFGTFSKSATKGYIGVGGGYDFNPNFGLSLNYDYTGVDVLGAGGHVGNVSVAAEVRF